MRNSAVIQALNTIYCKLWTNILFIITHQL